jgi:tetratricopeptide (TPR) repeat protein
MRRLIAIVAVAVFCSLAGAAAADDMHSCFADSGDVAIAACSRAINSRRYKKTDLARLYVNRGAEWDTKKEYDKELADLSEAVKYDSSVAAIYKNRAKVYRIRGEIERAITDYTTAIRLDPKYTAAFTNRGLAYEDQKDVASAKTDYHAALAMPPKYNDGAWAHQTARERLDALGDN